jgi:hypothetical protein
LWGSYVPTLRVEFRQLGLATNIRQGWPLLIGGNNN